MEKSRTATTPVPHLARSTPPLDAEPTGLSSSPEDWVSEIKQWCVTGSRQTIPAAHVPRVLTPSTAASRPVDASKVKGR
jgi:hypothetical protein